MASRKPSRTQRSAQVARIHTQTEINRRLYRASQLARCLYFESIGDNSILVQLCMSSVLSYLADDLEELQNLTGTQAV